MTDPNYDKTSSRQASYMHSAATIVGLAELKENGMAGRREL